MKVALIPVYVSYYEDTIPKLLKTKERIVRIVHDVISSEHETFLFAKVTDTAAARSAREKLLRDKVDCAVVLPLVATFSSITDELAKRCEMPFVLFSAMTGTAAPRPLTMSKVVAEGQSFGSQAIANGWMRRGVRFQALHQIPGTKVGNAALLDLLRVIDASVQSRRLRLGAIGNAFTEMTDIALPAKAFERATGSRIVRIPMDRIHGRMECATRQRLRSLETELRRIFVFGRLSSEEKEISLRAAAAIMETIQTEKLDCAAFNSHSPGGLSSKKLGLMCALGVTLATTAGCPMAEVGDLCTAFALWLGRRLGGASFYTELDSAYIGARTWLLLNSGEHDLAWVRSGFKPRLMRNTNFEGVNGRGASVCAPLREGPATMINFTPTPRAEKPYRIQFCEGVIVREWRQELGVGNATFRVPGDARSVYERWLAAGPVHHSATCPGHHAARLQLFCGLQGWNCLQIS